MKSFRRMLVPLVVWVAAMPTAARGQTPPPEPIRFHHDHVLGTSLDLSVIATDPAEAEAVELAVLREIERLNQVLNTWDENSQISLLNRQDTPLVVSPALAEVLWEAEQWRRRSDGAFNPAIGPAFDRWERAAKEGKVPSDDELSDLARQINRPSVRIDRDTRLATRLAAGPLRIDGLAKGYILDRAVTVAAQASPGVSAILLDIGGDMRAWHRPGHAHVWQIAITNPQAPADNDAPLTTLKLSRGGIATSGPYARGFDVGDQHFSHILDPRTARPVDVVLSVTVLAEQTVTADAVATAVSVLGVADGLALLNRLPGVEGLLVDREGRVAASKAWPEDAMPDAPAIPDAKGPGAAAFNIALELPALDVRRYLRPYVAVWITDAQDQIVSVPALWGDDPKYHRDLRQWTRAARELDQEKIDAVTRATRQPGSYSLSWDGRGFDGKTLATGDYTLHVEAAREKGGREQVSVPFKIGKAAAKAEATGKSELGAISITPAGGESGR